MPQSNAQPIEWELGMAGGLAPKWQANKNNIQAVHPELIYDGSPIYLSGQTYAGGVCNPLSVEGYLSPANATNVESATTLGGQQVAALYIPDAVIGDTIVFLERQNASGNLVIWSGSTHANSLVLTATTRTPSGSQFWIGTDMQIYQVNGVSKIFFAYRDNNSGTNTNDIAIFDLGVTSGNYTWLSGTVSGHFVPGANELKMFVADNGFMYVIDGSTLHKIDGTTSGGTNGTVTPNVLVFPAYFQLIDGLDTRGKAWITVNRIDKAQVAADVTRAFTRFAGVYVWDRQSIQSQMQDFIPIDGVKYVGHIFQFRGAPHVFTVSADNFTQLRQYTGSEFKVVAEAQATDFPPYKGCIQVTDQTIAWQGQSGNFFVYGRVNPYQYVDGLYLIGRNANYAHGGASGAIIMNDYSSGGNTTQEVYRISSGNFIYTWWAHADISTDGNTTIFPDSTEITTLVKRFYPPVGTTGNTTVCTVKVYVNNGTSVAATKVLTQTDVVRGFVYIPLSKNNVNNVRMTFTYNNAVSKALSPRFSHAHIEVSDPKKKI